MEEAPRRKKRKPEEPGSIQDGMQHATASIDWTDKLRHRPRTSSTSSNSGDNGSDGPCGVNEVREINPGDWAKSLFDDPAAQDTSQLPRRPVIQDVQNSRRPFNLAMIPACPLRVEPFWRTEPLEHIEKAWQLERAALIEDYESKHKLAGRLSKKKPFGAPA